ncbi:MAG: 50S ribosomal protein L2, partial [Bacteroidetes bacterium SW_10_40_5]
MAVKRLKPTTAGSRFTVLNKKSEVSTDKPEKSLTTTLSRKGGRNSVGRMTMRQIGGGHRRKYRIIDFKRDKFNVEGSIKTIEYDPSRSAFISLVAYKDGEKRYIITPQGLKVGNKILSGESVAPEVGNAMKLKHMPLGTIIHNIELRPGQGAEIARSAGTYAQLLARDGKYAIIKL